MFNEEGPRESIRPDDTFASEGETLAPGEGTIPTFDVVESEMEETARFRSEGLGRGTFFLNEIIGKGAEGVVWSAVQVSLDRIVAVKTFNNRRPAEGDTEEQQRLSVARRFYAEALITARLEHPNVVPLHDIGKTEDGMPLLAMKQVRGKPWGAMLKEDFAKLAVEEFLRVHLPIFVSMMQAVAFAHSRGVIHRDLKPAQVMVGEFGEVVLLDWGIAILMREAEERYRASGVLPPPIMDLPAVGTAPNPAGTPALMAPEQTFHDSSHISHLTDIYLLGGILYFLLTGTFPHDSKDSRRSIKLAEAGNIQHPEERTPGRQMPGDLVNLALKALQKKPEDRIQSVGEFITSINDFQTGASDRRRSMEQTGEVDNRLKSLKDLGLVIRENGDDFHVELSGSPSDLDRIYKELEAIRVLLEQATAAWSQNPALPSLRDRILACSSLTSEQAGDIRIARHLANQILSTGPRDALLERITRVEEQRARKDRIRHLALAGFVFLLTIVVVGSVYFTMKQRAISQKLAIERDNSDRLRDEAIAQRAEALESRAAAEAAGMLAREEAYFAKMNLANFALREGALGRVTRFLMETRDEPMRHWEWGRLFAAISSDSMTLQHRTQDSRLLSVAYSPDGSLIYTTDHAGMVFVFQANTGRLLREARVHEDGIWHLHLSADGNMLLATSFDRTASLIDTATLEKIHHLTGHDDVMRGGHISPDGTMAVTTGRDAQGRVWDTRTGEELFQLEGVEFMTYQASYSPDGSVIALAQRRRVTLHDATTGALLREPLDEPGNVLDFAFSPDGSHLAVACTDRFTRIYTFPDLEPVAELPQELSWLHSVDWHPEGHTLVTCANDGDIRIWDTSDWSLKRTIIGHPRAYHVRFSPLGHEFVIATPRAVQLWRLDSLPSNIQGVFTLQPMETDHPNPQVIATARSSPLEFNGAWNRFDSEFWNEEGSGRTTFQQRDLVIAIDSYFRVIEPNGNRALQIQIPSLDAIILDQKTNEVLSEWEHGRVFGAIWSPDGRHLGVVTRGGDFILHDGTTLEPRHKLGPTSPVAETRSARFVGTMAFDPQSELVFTGRRDGSIHIWSTADGSLIHDLSPGDPGVFAGRFSPDGRYFAAGGLGARGRVWDVTTGELVSTLIGHSEYILDLAFHPDNTRVLTASHDNQVKLWDTWSGREVQTVFEYPDERFVLGAGFSSNGRKMFSIVSDGTVDLVETSDWTISGDPPTLFRLEELEKRRRRINPDVTLEDVPSMNYMDTTIWE